MEISGLMFEPRSPESRGVIERKAIHGQAVALVGALTAAQAAAADEARRCAAEVEALHRAGGASAKVVATAESALATARAKAGEAWPERISGARLAVADAAGELQSYTAQHYDTLAAELADDAAAVAQRVDAALQELVEAHAAREQVSRRFTSLGGAVANQKPNFIAASRCESAVRAAGAVLGQGGEQAPVPTRPARVVEVAA